MNNKPSASNTNSNEDLSDKEDGGIITNIDEFCTVNELIQNSPKNNNNNIKNNNLISKIQHNKTNAKIISEPFKISSPIQNIQNNNNLN